MTVAMMCPEWELRSNFSGPFMPLDLLAQDDHPPLNLPASWDMSCGLSWSQACLLWLTLWVGPCVTVAGSYLVKPPSPDDGPRLFDRVFLCNHMAAILFHRVVTVSQDWGEGFVNINSFNSCVNPTRQILSLSPRTNEKIKAQRS